MDPILRLALAVVGALAGGAALLTAPCVAAAADPTPRDFAYGIPVVTTRDAAVYRFALPLAVYRDTTREDLGDVRIFNAQGEAVPYSLMRAVPPPRAREPAIGLPLFPLRGTAHIVMDGQHIAIESPGSSVNLRTQPVDPNTTVNQYVLDGRMMNAAVAALELNWPDTAVDYSGRIKVEASDASRCRIVLPPSPRRTKSSRQAMMWARVTVRNSSGRTMPVKRIKSLIAFS